MALRLGVFFGALAALLAWEALRPARPAMRRRWAGNFALGAINAGVLRLIAVGGLAGVAWWAERADIGLFAGLTDGAAGWLRAAVCFAALDGMIYLQHRLMHRRPALWALHRVHHTDALMDVSTALRFHPAEAVLSMAVKAAAVLALGVPVGVALAFELWLSVCALFNHTNARLPVPVERAVRRVLITPDLHRIHHSVLVPEHNSNFGFSVCWWDRLLGSYRDQPAAGQAALRLGLADRRSPVGLWALLSEPFTPPLTTTEKEACP
jgi:sterol desaturase/sphingolipid hydroxylase (fatty acid hydroxylase superfamily)